MNHFGLSEGATFSRPCPDCHATVTVLAPEKNGHGGDDEAWTLWRKLVRAQVMWPMLCPSCKAWWNERVNAGKPAARTPRDPEPQICERLMIGSGGDTWDPTCELPEGHEGSCKSSSAIDQNRLVA